MLILVFQMLIWFFIYWISNITFIENKCWQVIPHVL